MRGALAGREEPDADQHGVARPLLVRRAARLGSRAVLGHPAHPPARRAHLAPRPRALQQVRAQSPLSARHATLVRPHIVRFTLYTFDRAQLRNVHC